MLRPLDVQRQQQTLARLTREAAEELVGEWRAAPPGAASAESSYRAAVIGFVGPGIRGTLGVGMTDIVRARLAPVRSDPDDWHAEFANQLAGRLKRKLLRHGSAIELALPLVLRGVRLSLAAHELDVGSFVLPHEAGSIAFWGHALLSPEVRFIPTEDPEFQALPEGAVVLF